MATARPSLLARDAAGGNNTFSTAGMDTTGATLLVALTSIVATSAPAVISDSQSNTWTPLTGQSQSGQNTSQLFYVSNPTVGASHTVTITGSSIACSVIVFAFSGVTTSSPFDKENGAVGSASATSLATGSITPTTDGQLIIVGAASGGGSAATTGIMTWNKLVPGILSDGMNVPVVAGSYYGCMMGFGIQQTAAAFNPTISLSGTGTNSKLTAVIASFKAGTTSSGGGSWTFVG